MYRFTRCLHAIDGWRIMKRLVTLLPRIVWVYTVPQPRGGGVRVIREGLIETTVPPCTLHSTGLPMQPGKSIHRGLVVDNFPLPGPTILAVKATGGDVQISVGHAALICEAASFTSHGSGVGDGLEEATVPPTDVLLAGWGVGEGLVQAAVPTTLMNGH